MAEDAESLDSTFREMIAFRRPIVKYGNPKIISEKRRAQKNLEVLTQGLLHRSVNLLRASPAMVEQANVHGLALLTRGQLEATAQLGYFCGQLVSLKNGHISFVQFHERLAFTLMGASHPFFERAPKPVNILTCIDRADRHFQSHHENDASGIIRDCYSWLSDYCHPNFLSNISSFKLNKKRRRMEFRHDAKFTKEDGQILCYLDISAGIFVIFYRDILERSDVIANF